MKRDLKLNFDILEEIVSEIKKYRDALAEMQRAAASVIRVLGHNKSIAVDELEQVYTGFTADLKKCHIELTDLETILTGYLNEMQAIIRPNNKRAYLRVDRNDIWCNKQAIISACEDINSAITKRYLGMGDLSFGKSEAEKAREERNYRKLEEIWREVVPRFSRKLDAQIDALNRVYERKIIPFENKDDEYQSKATMLYYRYTSYWESLRTDVRDGARLGLDVVRGAITAVLDLAQGLVELAVGVVQYTAAAVALAVTAPFEVRPKWAGEIFAGTNTAIGSILNDPMLVVEGFSQSVADTVEEEGICYAIGYVAGDVLGSNGLSKLAAVRKATVVEKVDDVGDVAKVGGEVAEGLGSALFDFADRAKLEGHFDKHGAEFCGIYKNSDEYLNGAREVINNGIKVQYKYNGEIRTGYVRFMGNNKNGKAKFEFVGTNNNGEITTYHTQSGKKFWKTINGENIPVINPIE